MKSKKKTIWKEVQNRSKLVFKKFIKWHTEQSKLSTNVI